MQNAETVLNVIAARGARGLPLQRLYRQLFNRELFLLAYGRISSNAGAMTPGVTPETADGMSLVKIDAIIDALRHERYRWTPVKRVYIPKSDGKKRPLGLSPWSDKLVAEVVRLLLEAYYEPSSPTARMALGPGAAATPRSRRSRRSGRGRTGSSMCAPPIATVFQVISDARWGVGGSQGFGPL